MGNGIRLDPPRVFPDVESIRKGIICVAECEGMGGMRRGLLKHFSTFFSQFLCYYPFTGQCRCFHTGTMVNVLVSMLRQILPKNIRDQLQVGFQMDEHLGDALLVPTVEEANGRTIGRMAEALKLRYNNERSFSLSAYRK